ncbi:MAG: hypothetical protein AAF941_04665 [Pseudomonadota bacterium]
MSRWSCGVYQRLSAPFLLYMDVSDDIPPPQIVQLEAGAQAVINGALLTAREGCSFEVGSGAFVLTGPALRGGRPAIRNPRDELYFSLLEAGTNPDRFAEARFRLFHLLAEVVEQDRTHQAQRECAMCAAALMAGDTAEAVRCAARIASDRYEAPRGGRPLSLPSFGLRRKIAAASLRSQP